MDRISKTLRAIPVAQRKKIKQLLTLIAEGKFLNLDIKKLKGRDDVYRVRKGDWRIIFRKHNEDIYVLALERRDETTYKD